MADVTPSPERRRTTLIAAAVLVLALAGVGLLLVLRDTSDTPSTAAADAAATDGTATDGTATDGTPLSSPTDQGTDPAAGPASDAPTDPDGSATQDEVPVDLTPVTGTTETALCTAIVERLGQYRTAAADGIPGQPLIDALAEFEAQIDTQSDDQDWGDRIVEQLTNARREWATARSADSSGDSAEAARRAEAGRGRLDRAIDDCPTA